MPKVYRRAICLKYLIRATPIYEFLKLCDSSSLRKRVLDCGAGGKCPPLALFHDRGYETFGLEIGKNSLGEAQSFCKENKIELNILKGDMRRIPFGGGFFSFVFAYESIFFLMKKDIAVAMNEIERVLKPNGLCFVTFRSIDDSERRIFPESHRARRLLSSNGLAYHEDDEPEIYFNKFKILKAEKRIRKTLVKGKQGRRVYIDYIAMKK